MTPKEYADTMLVLSTGYAMVSMQKQGMAVSKMTDLVSAENSDYIKRNYDHLSKVLEQLNHASE